MNLIPKPKKTEIKDGFLKSKKILIDMQNIGTDDKRIEKALEYFKANDSIVPLFAEIDENTIGYTLEVSEDKITIKGKEEKYLFYAIQTLKQLFEEETVPCLYIDDTPDIEYRGVYHDVTRGRVPKVETMKKFIDKLAYYKINSLQLYVEHTFPFKEFGDEVNNFGYLTADEIKELDDYCYDNFIEFIPSIATFGHLFELLQLPKYKHLQCVNDYKQENVTWIERMNHHTIDPENPESFEIIKSLIDQYLPLFRSDKFNICCDETFDLKTGKHKDKDTGALYLGFVKKIIDYLKSKGKKVMMWGDILLQHPEIIKELPKDTYFLNWDYSCNPNENSFKTFSETGCTQYVCPGTSSWNRLIEGMSYGTQNITKTIDFGYKYGSKGVLNTNWGDWGNPCELDLSMYGLVLGAAKSWNINTENDKEFADSIGRLEYKSEKAVEYMNRLDKANEKISYMLIVKYYSDSIYNKKEKYSYPSKEDVSGVISECESITEELKNQVFKNDNYRQAILLCCMGLKTMACIAAYLAGYDNKINADIDEYIKAYSESWLKTNKESELSRIVKVFEFYKGL